jgi:hypothetical protein
VNLSNRDQVGHAVEVAGNKFAITSRFDFPPRFVNLGSQLILNVKILGQLPESKRQLNLGRHSCEINLVWGLTVLAVVS